MRPRLLAAFLIVVAPVFLPAQTLQSQTQALAQEGAMPMQIVSVNPFLPIFGQFQGEYERRLNTNASFAIAGSYTEWDSARYTNLDAKLRLYPEELAPTGLGLAWSLGFGTAHRVSYDDCSAVGGSCALVSSRTISAPTFAIEAQYQWLLGRSRATAVSAGFGAKRYFLSDADARDFNRVLPTGRLTIGYAF